MALSTYAPYGAFEMKASYQRNLLVALFVTVTFVGVVLVVYLIAMGFAAVEQTPEVLPNPGPIIAIRDIPPPPPIIREKPIFASQEKPKQVRVGPPVPVPDDEILEEEDMVIASREELAELASASDLPDLPSDGGFVIDTTDWLPPPLTTYIEHDEPVEMIYQYVPPYPRLAKMAGVEGIAWVAAWVDKNGNVSKAQIAASSGNDLLDEAAVQGAYKNKYKPAIRDGQPISIWVTYQVKFQLDH
ncbi:MAG: energy transducer TonB [Candidatus Zixiibacteriota bacterium]|nr:MAG: energy transducer TonB [candidate division Zixibacteria bacterium]